MPIDFTKIPFAKEISREEYLKKAKKYQRIRSKDFLRSRKLKNE